MARLKEKPVGICPACGQTVFNTQETDGPVWACPTDLSPDNPYWQWSVVTNEQQERDGAYSNCPSAHGLDDGRCEHLAHLPLHGACYDKRDY
jgi:hypothetical protein